MLALILATSMLVERPPEPKTLVLDGTVYCQHADGIYRESRPQRPSKVAPKPRRVQIPRAKHFCPGGN